MCWNTGAIRTHTHTLSNPVHIVGLLVYILFAAAATTITTSLPLACGEWKHRITKVKEIFPRNKHWIILAEPFTFMNDVWIQWIQRASRIMANWTQVNEAKPMLSYAKLSKAIFRSDTSISIWMHFILRCCCWFSSFISLGYHHVQNSSFFLSSFVYFLIPIVDVHQSIHMYACIQLTYRMKWPVQAKTKSPTQPIPYCLHCSVAQSMEGKVDSVWRNTNYVSRLTIKYKLINFSSDSLLPSSLLDFTTHTCTHAHGNMYCIHKYIHITSSTPTVWLPGHTFYDCPCP